MSMISHNTYHKYGSTHNTSRGQTVLTRVLGFLNQQKLTRGQRKNSGKTLLRPLLHQGGARTSSVFPCLFPEGGGELIP